MRKTVVRKLRAAATQTGNTPEVIDQLFRQYKKEWTGLNETQKLKWEPSQLSNERIVKLKTREANAKRAAEIKASLDEAVLKVESDQVELVDKEDLIEA